MTAEKEVDVPRSSRNCLAVVKGGVLVVTEMFTLQMWNFGLSESIRCWTNIGSVTGVFPVSEERVACTTEERKVIILDTTRGEVLSTIQIDFFTNVFACNSKFQILTRSKGDSLRLSDHKTTLWEKKPVSSRYGRFSLAETLVTIIFEDWSEAGICVFDAFSGKTLHALGSTMPFSKCEFVSDDECVGICVDRLDQLVVQLFNVKSGDLLSNLSLSRLRRNTSFAALASSPSKGLVAISPSDSEHGFELIQVRLPRDEESRTSKWTLNPGKHRKVQVGEQEECSCLRKDCYDPYKDRLLKQSHRQRLLVQKRLCQDLPREHIFKQGLLLKQSLNQLQRSLGMFDDDDNDDDYSK